MTEQPTEQIKITEAQSKSLHNALIDSFDSFAPPMPMQDNLVVRVARAICCARAQCQGCKGSGEGGCFDFFLWDAEARAAIAIMQQDLAARDAEIAALKTLAAAHRKLGAREAIAGVVAWLKGQYGDVGDTLADRIERGEHLAATEKGEG